MLLAEGRGWYCFGANRAAASSQRRAAPEEFPVICKLALKARLTGRALELIPDEPNRAFTADVVVLFKFLGRCPRLSMITAALRVNREERPFRPCMKQHSIHGAAGDRPSIFVADPTTASQRSHKSGWLVLWPTLSRWRQHRAHFA